MIGFSISSQIILVIVRVLIKCYCSVSFVIIWRCVWCGPVWSVVRLTYGLMLGCGFGDILFCCFLQQPNDRPTDNHYLKYRECECLLMMMNPYTSQLPHQAVVDLICCCIRECYRSVWFWFTTERERDFLTSRHDPKISNQLINSYCFLNVYPEDFQTLNLQNDGI